MKFVSLIETTFPSHLAKGRQGKVKESLEERGFFSLLGGFQGSTHPCVEAVGLAARGAFAERPSVPSRADSKGCFTDTEVGGPLPVGALKSGL